jgi:prepilin peptidase CpaA
MKELIGPLHILPASLLLVTATVAAITDIRSRRIPNALVITAFAAGLAANTTLGGLDGLWRAAAGAGLALLVYFPLFLLRGMGAGDVKLMAAAGALAGPRAWFWIFVLAAVSGAVAGLVLALARGRLRSTLINTGFIVRQLLLFRHPGVSREELSIHSSGALRLPHGVAIAFAVWVVVLVALLA